MENYRRDLLKRLQRFFKPIESRMENITNSLYFKGNTESILPSFKYRFFDALVARENGNVYVLSESIKACFLINEAYESDYRKQGTRGIVSVLNKKALTDEQIKNLHQNLNFAKIK